MRIFFTGDTHYGHANVIKYAKRLFSSVEEMNSEMVRRWNEVVTKDDLVYIVGDFAFCKPEQAVNIVRSLHGRKRIVFGNHDKQLRKNRMFLMQFEAAADYMEIKVPDTTAPGGKHQRITLLHYAMRVWNTAHHGSWQLYGHSHGTLPDWPNALQLDVGVDCWNFTPVSYETIKERMALKTWKPVDHHGQDRDE